MKKLVLILLLLAWLGSPVFPARLRFVVVSDTNPEFLNQRDFSLFEKIIEQINVLKPDLVINTGDLIYGYGLKSTRPQWERYLEIIKRVEAPYYQIPGNHDVFNNRARKTYLEIFQKTYLSFDFGGYHFVLLDNLEDGIWGKIGPEQLSWLQQDLAHPSWEGAFVFVHVPVWDMKAKNVKLEWREFWFNNIHPLLLQSRVRAVFAGHNHRFGPTRIYDGLFYYIAGGGGGNLHKDYVRAGGRNFFLLVEMTDNGFKVNVVMENRIISDSEADILKELFAPHYYLPGITGSAR
ncbi:MAG: metallophosphoesterase family protein [Candidatus Saccharicenans sp.]|uniref:metallophosphoesterase family protein n=1 Tax=Candidatus Saccharicenans sp. TaxID=2819258 RepID=UPI00404B6539